MGAIAGTSTTTVTVTPQLNIEGGFLGILTSEIAQTNLTYNIVTKTTNTGFNNPNLNGVTITSSSDTEKLFLSQIAGQAFVIQQQTLYNLGAGNKILETATALVASQGTIGEYIYSPQATLVQHAEGIGILALEAAPSVFLVPIGEAEPLAAQALGTITSSSAASLPTQALGGLVITEVSGAATTEASSLVLTGRPASATSLGYSVAFSTAAVGATYLAAGAYGALSSVVKPYIGTQIITFSESTGENGVPAILNANLGEGESAIITATQKTSTFESLTQDTFRNVVTGKLSYSYTYSEGRVLEFINGQMGNVEGVNVGVTTDIVSQTYDQNFRFLGTSVNEAPAVTFAVPREDFSTPTKQTAEEINDAFGSGKMSYEDFFSKQNPTAQTLPTPRGQQIYDFVTTNKGSFSEVDTRNTIIR